MAQGDALDAAIKSYADKIKANPDSLVFVQLADGYRKKGDLEAAIGACRTGLARHPHLLSGLLMLGRIHAARREYPEAVEALKKVVQREPNNLTAHALMSQAYLSLGRWAEAISEYQRILALNPEDTAAQNALQEALERMRRERADTASAPAAAAPGASPAAPAAPPAAGAIAAVVEEAADISVAPEEPAAPAAPAASRAAPPPMEVPAYAAAEELAERGLYDEAIEALQRILEADPDNFMARQKLREVYAQREAMESPSAGPEPPSRAAGGGETHADKISDEEILYLLGIMEDAAGGPVPAAAASGASPAAPAAPARPAAAPAAPPVRAAEPPKAREVAPVPAAAAETPERAAIPEEEVAPPVSAPAEAVPVRSAVRPGAAPLPAGAAERVLDILGRLAGTEGLMRAYFVAGGEVVTPGPRPAPEQAGKIATLVSMLSDVTRKAALGMKQGDVKQVLVFGTEGMVMVSPATGGILAAVAGGGVRVGLLRLALNDCLKRLAEVS